MACFTYNTTEVQFDFFVTENNIFSKKERFYLFVALHVCLCFICSTCAHSYIKKMVIKPAKLQRKKQRSQDLCWKVLRTVHNLLFCTHTLWMNYVTVTFLLASSSGTNRDLLCFVHGQGQKSEQKHRTSNFSKLHNHLHLLHVTAIVCFISVSS